MDRQREEMRARWDRGAQGWRRRADSVMAFGLPVSARMVEDLAPQPGQTVLELAAGPGDTGFMISEQLRPSGRLISSDASEAMLEVARDRAAQQGIANVEFKRLELEWIDLPTASVDAVVCRWGLMFVSDPAASLQEMRRVLRPGGRAALAVWGAPEVNPWATATTRALVELGHAEPPDPTAPGMFALGDGARLRELLESAGFVEAHVELVDVARISSGVEDYLAESADLNPLFLEARERISPEQWRELQARVAELLAPFETEGGGLRIPGRSLVAIATA